MSSSSSSSSVNSSANSSANSSSSSSSEDEDDNKYRYKDINNINNNANITFESSVSASSSDSGSSSTVAANNYGEILRTAMLRNGISPHNGKSRLINCRGLGTCGTCAVEIYNTNGGDNSNNSNNNNTPCSSIEPKERNTKENLRLNFPPHNFSKNQSSNLRLACQVQVKGDITVKKRTGFWGQGTQKDSIIQQQKQQQQEADNDNNDNNNDDNVDDDDYKEFDKAELWFGELEYILDNKSPSPSPRAPSPPSSSSGPSSSKSSS